MYFNDNDSCHCLTATYLTSVNFPIESESEIDDANDVFRLYERVGLTIYVTTTSCHIEIEI